MLCRRDVGRERDHLRAQRHAANLLARHALKLAAFLDAIDGLREEAYDMPFLCDVVKAVKNNLAVDWTKPHRASVKASVRTAIKQVLRRRGVKREHFCFIQHRIMEQAEALYEDWPKSA